MTRRYFASALLGMAALPASAQVVAEQSVLREEVRTTEGGRTEVVLIAADRVAPGDTVAYVLNYRNDGEAPAADLVLVMPVPEATSYLPGTASGPVASEVSVDGGGVYGELAELSVSEAGERRPAAPGDVTHLRWALDRPLAPGARGEVAFRARLR